MATEPCPGCGELTRVYADAGARTHAPGSTNTVAEIIEAAIRTKADREDLWGMRLSDIALDDMAEEITEALARSAPVTSGPCRYDDTPYASDTCDHHPCLPDATVHEAEAQRW